MKYRTRVVLVEAEQFLPDVKPWPEGVAQGTPPRSDPESYWLAYWDNFHDHNWIAIHPYYWIVTKGNGEVLVMKPEDFAATYEKDNILEDDDKD